MYKSSFLTSKRKLFLLLIALLSLQGTYTYAISNTNDIKEIGMDEKLGSVVSPDIEFVNRDGKRVTLGSYLGEKPVVINMLYFSCPRVCTFALEGSLEVINNTEGLKLEDDYRFLSVSFNPEENSTIAAEKSDKFLKGVKDGQKGGWAFLTADSENIKKLTDSMGYNFKKDGEEFAHPSALIVLTPEGKISRYLYGIQHDPRDFKLALIESSDGKIGDSSLANKVLLFCYQFDPIGKRYALKALNIVKAGGMVTLLALSGFLAFFWVREKGHSNNSDGGFKN